MPRRHLLAIEVHHYVDGALQQIEECQVKTRINGHGEEACWKGRWIPILLQGRKKVIEFRGRSIGEFFGEFPKRVGQLKGRRLG